MGDDASQDQPAEQVESELNELIAEAESLTEALLAEVGQGDPQSTSREANFFESETDSEASLDLQIAQADAMLDVAEKELGKPRATPKRKKKVTLPPKGQAKSGPTTAPQDAPPATAVSRTATLPTAEDARATDRSPQTPPESLVAAQTDDAPFGVQPSRPPLWERLSAGIPVDRLSALSRTTASATCVALELIDRPFHFVNFQVRTIMGWLALVFGVAAVSIYLLVVR